MTIYQERIPTRVMRTFVLLFIAAFLVRANESVNKTKIWFHRAVPFWEAKSVIQKSDDTSEFKLDYNSNFTRTVELHSYEKVIWVKEYENKCLSCIQKASEHESETPNCNRDECGSFKISWTFWRNAGYPHHPHPNSRATFGVFRKCVEDKTCAEHTIIEFWNRFGVDCDQNGKYDCFDLALIYKAGHTRGCNETTVKAPNFWTDFTSCMA